MNTPVRKVLVTGVCGRVGRAIRAELLALGHHVIGLDRLAGSSIGNTDADAGIYADVRAHVRADVCADLGDAQALRKALAGVDAVVHVAALHAPHVGRESDAEFVRINVDGTRRLLDCAAAAGVGRIVFTSTTALYGDAAIAPDRAVWVDEALEPRPRTIYHRTKLAAEVLLREAAAHGGPSLRILRMSRCFPEPADAMAVMRLHRGIDAHDVAAAHVAAISHDGPACATFVVSAASPFLREDAHALATEAPAVIARRCPALTDAFAARGWTLPQRIDRVYCADAAMSAFGWRPRFGFETVLRAHDAGDREVLPPRSGYVIDGDLRE